MSKFHEVVQRIGFLEALELLSNLPAGKVQHQAGKVNKSQKHLAFRSYLHRVGQIQTLSRFDRNCVIAMTYFRGAEHV